MTTRKEIKKASNGAEQHITTLKKELSLLRSTCIMKKRPISSSYFNFFIPFRSHLADFFYNMLQKAFAELRTRWWSCWERKREFFSHSLCTFFVVCFGRFRKINSNYMCWINRKMYFLLHYWYDIKKPLSFLLQENLMISPKTNFNDYYKSLRCNVMTFFEHNRLPPPIVGSNDNMKK